MSKYNANGGQRRSKSVKLAIPNGQSGFAQFMVSLIKIKDAHGPNIALAALEKYSEKYRIEDSEFSFLKSLVSK